MTTNAEGARLREFWNRRYEKFTLSESGWSGAGEGLNEHIYACKQQALRKAIVRLGLTADRRWSILDAGCGQGHFARFYRAEFPLSRYLGIDISDRAIAHLQRTIPDSEFHIADLCTWSDASVPSDVFDLVQSMEVLHLSLDDDAMMAALSNIAGRVAPGGALVITAALLDETTQRSDYLRYRSQAFWNAAFAALGLRIVADDAMYYWLPAGGPSNKYLRYALTRLGPAALYAIDRVALALSVPQPASIGIDSRMRLLTLQRA
jgi:SAM-dependent methyltransferase